MKSNKSKDTTIEILYCGNFGNLHDSATLFHFWSEVLGNSKDLCKKFRWCFLCSGPKYAELLAVIQSLPEALKKQIQIGGGLEKTEWITAMESADVALVTMAPGSETVVMPSKTYSAMMAGQAILAIAPEDSDLVDIIKESNCGWWVAPGNVKDLAQTLSEINLNKEALMEKRKHAYYYAHAHYGQDAVAEKWQNLLDNLK